MAFSAILLDEDGWARLITLLEAGQSNNYINANIIRHLRELGAETILIESEYLDRDFTEAFAEYYSKLFKRHTKLCTRVHFFKRNLQTVIELDAPSALAKSLEECQSDYLGFLVLRQIHEAPLAQASLLTPAPPTGYENHVLVKADYDAHILGAKLTISSLPMTQQDQRIGACAQATIWSASRHFHAKHKGPWISTVGITEAAMMQEFASVSSTIPNGSEFLSLNGMVSALRACGRKPLMYMGSNTDPPVWHGIRPRDVINRYVDSGIPVIVGLGNLGSDVGHAVIATGQVFSHHPPSASDLPPQPTRASFCAAYYVNDDQQGPNLRMPINSGYSSIGETPYNLDNNVQFLLIPLPDKVFLPAEKAEVFAWDLLNTYFRSWHGMKKDNSEYLGGSDVLGDQFVAEIAQNTVIARTYLTYGWKYKHRLLRNRVKDATQWLARSTELPRYVWVTEFGTLSSFSDVNIYNRRIFAHCVVDATAKNMGEDSRLFFHAPGLVIRRYHDDSNPSGPYLQGVHVIADDQSYFPKLRGNIDFAGYL